LSNAGLRAVGDFPMSGFAYGGGDQAPVQAYGHAELTIISLTGSSVVAFWLALQITMTSAPLIWG